MINREGEELQRVLFGRFYVQTSKEHTWGGAAGIGNEIFLKISRGVFSARLPLCFKAKDACFCRAIRLLKTQAMFFLCNRLNCLAVEDLSLYKLDAMLSISLRQPIYGCEQAQVFLLRPGFGIPTAYSRSNEKLAYGEPASGVTWR